MKSSLFLLTVVFFLAMGQTSAQKEDMVTVN